ncbi:MAG TPA: M15 family metallopeptidase [Clostridia bacterium]|nr:M15 family metallopeptidase [Clostridia bacterium]
MKEWLRRLILTCMALFIFAFGWALSEESKVQEVPEMPEASWSFPVSRETMEDPQGLLVLANNRHLLSKDFEPDDLVNIDVRRTSSSKIQMRRIVSDALSLMFEDAKAEGIILYVHSGYRSYRTQDVLHYNRVKDMGYDDKLVIQAGASDHQTGMGADVISKDWIGKKFNSNFAKTKEAQWLAANCSRYGFIIRYPEGKEEITEINFEPWHLRFVGVEAAQYIMGEGLTLEEFIEQWEAYRDGGGDRESAKMLSEESQWQIVPVTEP